MTEAGDLEAAIAQLGPGQPVPPELRAQVESRFGQALEHVRVHDSTAAHVLAAAVGARAFAYGKDIVLGKGESATDPKLMQHELTHVLQQAGQRRIQTKGAGTGSGSAAEMQADHVAESPTALLADPAVTMTPGPKQMLSTTFFNTVQDQLIAMVESQVGPSQGAACPYIRLWFTRNAEISAAQLEKLAMKFGRLAGPPTSAADYIPAIVARARAGVIAWQNGGVAAIAGDLAAAGLSSGDDAPTPQAVAAEGLQKKESSSLAAIERDLGEGQALTGRQAGLASSVGADVGSTRIHTGSAAASKASEHGAHAFAAGSNIVMGSGVGAEGTAEGDALLLHEAAHVAQQQDAARDPAQRKKPLGDEEQGAEGNADKVAALGAFAGKVGDVMRTGVQLQRCADPAKPAKALDQARYKEIETKLKNLIAQKQEVVKTGTGDMAAIDVEIDSLITELRSEFGVRLDKGRILEAANMGQDMLVVDGRIVLSPSGSEHFMGERLGFKLEVDHVPPGETLQLGWRWRTPGSSELYRFLINGPAFSPKTKSMEMELDTPFWGLVPPAVEKAKGIEVVTEIYIGDVAKPTKTFSTGFIAMPERPVGDLKIVGAPERAVQGSHLDLGLGPWTPDFRRYSIDWFVDDKQAGVDQLALRHQFGATGKHTARADVFKVKRDFGIQEKTFLKRASVEVDVLTQQQYGDKFLQDVENSPFQPKPVGLGDLVASGDKSIGSIQKEIDKGGSQAKYWEDRLKSQKERLEKLRELAPDHANAKPLPPDPTKLAPGGSYSGPFVAALVMSEGGGGAQPLTVHLTIKESSGKYEARIIDSTSKKVLKFDGSGGSAIDAYHDAFETWRTDNEYPTGGTIVHRFNPPGWTKDASFSTTTSWKKAKDWVDGIIQVGGFIVGALLLGSPDPTISKLIGGVLMAAVIARSSIAIYERIRNGGDVLSSENILDGIAIVTSIVGVSGGALRSAGIKAINPTAYRAGNWMIMGAVAADAGTFIYASAEAIATLKAIQSNPTMDDGQKSGEMLRIMASLFVTGALLIASNRELLREGLKPHDFIKSKLDPGMKPDLDVGARLDAEYELKKTGKWTKDTSKLSDEALLDTVFTQRSRQELEAKLAKQAGAGPAASLAKAVGDEAFIKMSQNLDDATMVALAKGVEAGKVTDLHDAFGTDAFATLIKELGVPGVKKLATDLDGSQIKKLVDDVGYAVLKELGVDLPGKEIQALVDKLTPKVARELGEKLGGKGLKEVHDKWKTQGTKDLHDELGTKGMEDIGSKGLANIDKKLTAAEIKEWLAELGAAKMKKVSESYGGDAMKHYGKEWMRDYKGFTSKTEHHAKVGDGLDSSKGVNGCHDLDEFMNLYVTPRPKKVHVHTQRTTGTLTEFDYSVMKADGSGPKAKHHFKTAMKGLAADWATLQPNLEKEVDKAIKNMSFPKTPAKGPHVTSNGVKWEFWFRDGEIATIYPVL